MNLDYLTKGNSRQQLVFKQIKLKRLWDVLSDYNPVLAGTIPLGIDTPESDLDILCQVADFDRFIAFAKEAFSLYDGFSAQIGLVRNEPFVSVSFNCDGFVFEIFAQDKSFKEQHAYRHMLIEDYFLRREGQSFSAQIMELRSQGMKTEPAFATVLGLSGDPYLELLKMEEQIKKEHG